MNLQQELDKLQAWSVPEVCGYLATKVRRIRRESKESQVEFARRAGIPLRTYKRFETHGKANLETFIQVLAAIGRTQYLFMLFPQTLKAPARPTFDERLRQLTPTKFR
uniref:hypothetical protein n=1 Tax=Hylemonella sp. TaxID=2066020 RepID=UPI00391D6C69